MCLRLYKTWKDCRNHETRCRRGRGRSPIRDPEEYHPREFGSLQEMAFAEVTKNVKVNRNVTFLVKHFLPAATAQLNIHGFSRVLATYNDIF